jgi:putative ATPase
MIGLTEKYRPSTIDGFNGLARPKRILSALAAAPYSSAWLLVGPSGLGKTTMAMALAETIGGQMHHVPSRQCDLATVEKTVDDCHYAPFFGGRFHTVIVDEADQMTRPAQHAFLSVLDSTAPPPDTIFVFTANGTATLEERFVSRCRVVEFSDDEIDFEEILKYIWSQEAMDRPEPNYSALIKGSNGNVRRAIMDLELELITAAPPKTPTSKTTIWWDATGKQLNWDAISERLTSGNFEGIRFEEVAA